MSLLFSRNPIKSPLSVQRTNKWTISEKNLLFNDVQRRRYQSSITSRLSPPPPSLPTSTNTSLLSNLDDDEFEALEPENEDVEGPKIKSNWDPTRRNFFVNQPNVRRKKQEEDLRINFNISPLSPPPLVVDKESELFQDDEEVEKMMLDAEDKISYDEITDDTAVKTQSLFEKSFLEELEYVPETTFRYNFDEEGISDDDFNEDRGRGEKEIDNVHTPKLYERYLRQNILPELDYQPETTFRQRMSKALTNHAKCEEEKDLIVSDVVSHLFRLVFGTIKLKNENKDDDDDGGKKSNKETKPQNPDASRDENEEKTIVSRYFSKKYLEQIRRKINKAPSNDKDNNKNSDDIMNTTTTTLKKEKKCKIRSTPVDLPSLDSFK